MGELDGQTYLVTGASKGIGRAICLKLATNGARIVLLARPSKELERTLADVQALVSSSIAAPCDLGEPSSIDAAVQHILGEVGASSTAWCTTPATFIPSSRSLVHAHRIGRAP